MEKGQDKQIENNEIKKEEKKDENNAGKSNNKVIVLKAFMHCEGCSDKVFQCLRRFDGVEDVEVDRANHRVTVKGKATIDPVQVLDRLRKKYRKNVELISPKPTVQKKKEPEKMEQAQLKTVVLKMNIHCEGCSNDIKKNILKMKGVVSVELNKEKSHVTVRGAMEAEKLVADIKKRLRKHAEIVKQEATKGGGEGSKGGGEGNKGGGKGNEGAIIIYSYPPQYSAQYLCPTLIFSDENVQSCSIM